MKRIRILFISLIISAVSHKTVAQGNLLTGPDTSIAGISILSAVKVYPDPVVSNFTFSVNSTSESPAVLRLIDLLGRTALERPVRLAGGDNIFDVNMEDMASGIYQLVLQTDSKRIVYKLIKAR